MGLHRTGSNNPVGVRSNFDKIPFHPYFRVKDIVGWIVILTVLGWLVLWGPWALGDRENFLEANPIVTPTHIKPEWYFLFAYAILRSIPNKVGGVVGLLISVLILLLLPILTPLSPSHYTTPLFKILFWGIISIFIILTWIGGRPVESPYYEIGQITRGLYFMYFIFLGLLYYQVPLGTKHSYIYLHLFPGLRF